MMHPATALLHSKTIDRYNGEKLYIQLTRVFLDLIASGRWQVGQRIPSEAQLCAAHDVSKITVRQAINNLASDGYVIKIQGKGTFVTGILPLAGLSMRTRFTEEMFREEVKVDKTILHKGAQEPPPEIRKYLNIDDRIYHVLCRRSLNGEPAYLDDSYIPLCVLPEIEETDLSGTSLYCLLKEKGTRKISKLLQTIEISIAEEKAADCLDIDRGAPLLAVHRLLLSADNSPVAYTRLLGRSDRYKLQTEFERIR